LEEAFLSAGKLVGSTSTCFSRKFLRSPVTRGWVDAENVGMDEMKDSTEKSLLELDKRGCKVEICNLLNKIISQDNHTKFRALMLRRSLVIAEKFFGLRLNCFDKSMNLTWWAHNVQITRENLQSVGLHCWNPR